MQVKATGCVPRVCREVDPSRRWCHDSSRWIYPKSVSPWRWDCEGSYWGWWRRKTRRSRYLCVCNQMNQSVKTFVAYGKKKRFHLVIRVKKKTNKIPGLEKMLGLSWQYRWAKVSIILSIFWASPGSLKLHRNCLQIGKRESQFPKQIKSRTVKAQESGTRVVARWVLEKRERKFFLYVP